MNRFTRDLEGAQVPAPAVAPKTVLVIAGLAWSLVNFRLTLMQRMMANGHRVLAAAPDFDPETETRLRAEGIEPLTVPMHRTGLNPSQDVQTLRALRKLIRDRRPDVILPYTMKPIVYGCLAARLERHHRCYPLFTGLGYAFSEDAPQGKRRVVRRVAIELHRRALRAVRLGFYYNSADLQDLRRFRMIPEEARMVAIPGSGADTDHFAATPIPDGIPVFLFVARMLRSKGISDLLQAARILRDEGRAFRLELLGPTDSNPDAIDAETLQLLHDSGEIIYHGATRDVRPYLRACHVFVLPTRLREGVPRTILEAMSSARAVITTDAPGCGETVGDGEGGVVVPKGDPVALAGAMRRFLDDPDLAARMGRQARERVRRNNDIHAVNRLLLTEMGLEAEPRIASPPAIEHAVA
ncbi:Glycosyltransferase involved in cell wall bisynthesis [Paracoccus isoporae]|uniref:Glycosyltransferase involved in cell wall bisynthesis n=1 Tax=Paracoccus isoporae TaxID=591205 RepID=A0A1G6UD92_9RHOB|nr:glycosyltransferase family 4 protein [Paracoccus isoporae]SDD38656.1 Glycosyltransferase involved in cell wall bisynthesis [Paracoccus isoporae]